MLNILIKSGKSAALSDLNSVKCADCIHGQWFARSVDQIDFIKDAAPLNCHGMYSHLSSETLQLGRENSRYQKFISFAEQLEHCGSLSKSRSFKTKLDITKIYIGSEKWQI